MIVNPSLQFYGGAATALAHLSDYLNSKGIDNLIVTLFVTEEFLRGTERLNVSVSSKWVVSDFDDFVSRRSVRGKVGAAMGGLLELRAQVARHKHRFNLINPHNFPANWSSVLQGKPVVWMMNEPLDVYSVEAPPLWVNFLREMAVMTDRFVVRNYVSRVCVNSYLTCRQAKRRYRITPEVVLFGVDCDLYSKSSPEKVDELMCRYNLFDKFIVITSGDFLPQKNQLASVKAIESVRSVIPSVKLVLAGGGEESYMALVREYVACKHLDPYVVFTGHVSIDEISNMYHLSHVGLYPFREQGGLLAPFETLAAGTPVIISKDNGASELIAKYKLGIVMNDYANAIIAVHDNYHASKSVAELAKQIIKKEFSWNRYCERLVKVFESVYTSTL